MSNNNKKKDLIKILDTIIQNNSNNESNNILNQIGGKRYSQKEVDKMLIEALQHIISIYQNSINDNYMIKQKIYELVDAKGSTLPKTEEEQNGGYKSYSKTEVDSLMISYFQTILLLYTQSQNEKYLLLNQLKNLQQNTNISNNIKQNTNISNNINSSEPVILQVVFNYVKTCIGTLKNSSSSGDNGINSLILSLDSKILYSGYRDNKIKMWDVTNIKHSKEIHSQNMSGSVTSLALSSDGTKIYSASKQNFIKVWKNNLDKKNKYIHRDKDTIVKSVALSSDNKFLYSGSYSLNYDGAITIWDLTKPETYDDNYKHYTISAVPPSLIILSPDNKFLYSFDEQYIIIFDLSDLSNIKPKVFGTHDEFVYSLVISSDGKTLYSGSKDKTIKIWDLSIPNKLIHTLKGHSEGITSLVLSSDNKILYSGSNNNIKIWDLTTPNKDCIYTLQLRNKNVTSLNNYVTSLALSLDGKTLYSGSDDGNINIWQ